MRSVVRAAPIMVQVPTEEARQLAYPAILQQLAEGVIVTDAVGTITFVNNAAAAMHGVARLDVRPNAYAATYHLYREDGRPYPSEDLPLARAVRGETVTDARWRIRRPDGREVLAIGTAQPLRGANGRRIGAVLTVRDITGQDVTERSLRKSQAALHDIQQRFNAAGAADGKIEPASGRNPGLSLKDASRRIKAPLQEILDHATLILQATSPSDARSHGEAVRTTGSALLSLVDMLLGLPEADASHNMSDRPDLPPKYAASGRTRP